ncbi:Zinc finger BED domain-containing protein 1 [Merluccius polli]|uniref:Zinc finger BED domain-containing protein 1 n=1 Tax=Merluccius polli TaxID=89951 RepID=A0AA47P6K5_MERPO|nr:Zinc finger BED domain-containing protein 1 [Merluccius polli]
MLHLPSHQLIQDISTRWNSSHDIAERYLEQKVAVYPALTDQTVKKNMKDIVTCDTSKSTGDNTSPATADNTGSPENKSAMAELFGELFTTEEQGTTTKAKVIEEEVISSRAVDCIPLDADPLTWRRTKEQIYPHVAKLARRYLAVTWTSVPSERLFSTVGDIVTASRSVLITDNVDRLIFKKKYTCC